MSGFRHQRKAVLCKPIPGSEQTCFVRKTEARSKPCPNCEGYREPDKPIIRELLGWESENGIMKPIYSWGERPVK